MAFDHEIAFDIAEINARMIVHDFHRKSTEQREAG